MKLVIFAGGKGTRLWPLSRINSPKQFDKIFNDKSTIQLAFDRVAPHFGVENIYIQTIDRYKDEVLEQLPRLPRENIFVEPAQRNLGPAVCFCVNELKKRSINGPMAILWADHLMDKSDEFINALKNAKKLIEENPHRFVFLGERARFANNNLGWIKIGKKIGNLDGIDYYSFEGWKYKPSQEDCDRMFRSGEYFWNPGYFITSVNFLEDKYKELAKDIYDAVVGGKYEEAEATHFDRAIIEKVDLSGAVVLKTNMGWSDPGTLYALKKALEKYEDDNVIQGKVCTLNTSDSLLYNLDNNKILAGVGLKGMVVVNTKDALIVVPKEEVVNVSNLVKKMKKEGLDEYL
ncbi:hypothetical protein K8R62_03035 [bacterium]|nr:hypothetical protein [bacterium]